MVSPDYFDTLQIPLHQGRVFTAADRDKAPNVAIVNEAMAKKFWPGQDVIGKHFRFAVGEPTSVGSRGRCAGHEDQEHHRRADAVLLRAAGTELHAAANVHLRTSVPPDSIKRQVVAPDSGTCADASRSPARESLSEDLGGINGYLFYQLGAQLTGTIGLLGLVLAIVGVYSVVSYAAVQRTHEIGIRVALGARRVDILKNGARAKHPDCRSGNRGRIGTRVRGDPIRSGLPGWNFADRSSDVPIGGRTAGGGGGCGAAGCRRIELHE